MRSRGSRAALVASLIAAASCGPSLWDWPGAADRALLDESLALGTSFLLHNQKPAGHFNYEYDWIARRQSADDNQVRQVGAMWGLALIYHDGRDPKVAAAFDRALAFFSGASRVRADGARYTVYPGASRGQTGTTALAALSLIDYLRADPPLTADRRARYERLLDEYLAHLWLCRRPNGQWFDGYSTANGNPAGGSNPYVDGEALLALVKAARYLGRDQHLADILASADAGYWHNVVRARALSPDSATTKGYYQWSTMAMFELATSDWPGTDKYAARAIELADWMIDTHRTLARRRNTAYAYEGIVHAYELARRAGDRAHTRKLGQVIAAGLGKLTSWQVGSPTANAFIAAHPTDDPIAIGGVQNHAREAPLRIDVTQHQMHAVILARRYYFTE